MTLKVLSGCWFASKGRRVNTLNTQALDPPRSCVALGKLSHSASLSLDPDPGIPRDMSRKKSALGEKAYTQMSWESMQTLGSKYGNERGSEQRRNRSVSGRTELRTWACSPVWIWGISTCYGVVCLLKWLPGFSSKPREAGVRQRKEIAEAGEMEHGAAVTSFWFLKTGLALNTKILLCQHPKCEGDRCALPHPALNDSVLKVHPASALNPVSPQR